MPAVVVARCRLVCPLVLMLVVTWGCGSGLKSPVPVSGKVTVRGQPLTGGTIRFNAVDRQTTPSGYAGINPDGTYKATTNRPEDGLAIGSYTVFIDPPLGGDPNSKVAIKPDPQGGRSGGASGKSSKGGGGGGGGALVGNIPQKYLSPATSGLTVKVEGTTTALDLVLE